VRPPALPLLLQVYAALSVLLLPVAFRRSYGASMAHLFADLYREGWSRRGWRGGLRVAGREMAGLARTGWSERRQVSLRGEKGGASLITDTLAGDQRGRGVPGGQGPAHRRAPLLLGLLDDVHDALRTIIRNPALSLAVVVILALGIGANTAIFSVVDDVLLRDLPYPNHEELVGDGAPVRVDGGLITADFFTILGATASHGRLLSADDFAKPQPEAVVLSDRLWRQRWGADPTVVGSTIPLEELQMTVTVVGVLDPEFEPPEALVGSNVDIWVPLDVAAPAFQSRRMYVLSVLARLAPGVSRAAAQTEVDALSDVLAEEYPESQLQRDGSPLRYELVSLLDATVGDVAYALLLLMGAVGLLLLIACANVANLFLARGADRHREMALRSALGAGRGRVAAQLLTESVWLSVVGGLLGVGIAFVGVSAFNVYSPDWVPRAGAVAVDQRVLWFALGLSCATGLLFGVVPARRAAHADATGAFKDAGTATANRRRITLRSVLVVAEIAFSLVLLVGAGLLFNSFVRLRNVELGFESRDLVAFSLDLGQTFTPEQRLRFTDELMERIAAVPGVDGVAASSTIPLGTGGSMCCWGETIQTVPETEMEPITSIIHPVTPDYFGVLGADVVEGRGFTSADFAARPAPVVMSAPLARQLFGDEGAVGKTLRVGEEARTVVGIAGDIRHWRLERGGSYGLYLPYPASGGIVGSLQVAVKSGSDPGVLAGPLRQAVWDLRPDLPVGEILTMSERVSDAVTEPRFYSVLVVAFAGIATFLAAAGIYSSVLYAVGQRHRELGIRRALGATQINVAAMVFRQGFLLTASGVSLGLAGAIVLSRTLEAFLFEITATDVSTYTSVSLLLAAVALIACYVPARRAARSDPMEILRSE